MKFKMFKIVPKLLLLFIIFVVFDDADTTDDNDGTYCDGDGWIAFRDEKCYKLIKKRATQIDAKDMCAKETLWHESSRPQLVSIKSVDEQEFLADYIFNKSGVKPNVWTAARRVADTNQFVWNDGSSVEDYTNWAWGSPSESGERSCMVMTLRTPKNKHEHGKTYGKWVDVSCVFWQYYVICEKLPRWSQDKLQKLVAEIRSERRRCTTT